MRFPKVYSDELEVVLINTAGGITGGDRLDWNINLATGCHAVATTQACEKAYRSSEGMGTLTTCLHLEAASTLHWLPQETILYDGCNLNRSLDVDMASDATLLALESIVLGRQTRGERLTDCRFADRWRVKREGKLIFADDFKLTDRAASSARMDGGTAMASLLFAAPLDGEVLAQITRSLRDACPLSSSGFSTFAGKVTGRIIAESSFELRRWLVPIVEILRGAALPRVWRI